MKKYCLHNRHSSGEHQEKTSTKCYKFNTKNVPQRKKKKKKVHNIPEQPKDPQR